MNRFLLFTILLLETISCSSQVPAPSRIQKFVNQFVADPSFRSAGVGIVISDLESGKQIASSRANLGLTPASALKLITTATALEVLGSNYQFCTQIQTDGKISNGVLHGNLIVKGFGDPSFGSEHFAKQKNVVAEIAEKIRNLAIESITGQLIADNSYFSASIPRTWIWEDIGNYYGAIPNGLTYKDNLYRLVFESGKAGGVTRIKRTEPAVTGLEFDNQVVSSTTNSDLAYIFGGTTSTKRRIEGSIPQNRSEFVVKGALPSPKESLLYELSKALQNKNITIENQTLKKGEETILFSIFSPELKEIVSLTNQKSVNLFADHLLFELGKQKYKVANWKTGTKAVVDFWKRKGIHTDGIFLYDGSGLSHFNTVSAIFFDQILCYMYKSANATEFIRSLPVAGTSGTLQSFGKNTVLEGNWKAKTGSMTGIRSYCGYLTGRNGRTYTVSIIINNYLSSKVINNKLTELLIQIYNS